MLKLGLIGGGVMGEAILSRLIAEKVYEPHSIVVSDPSLQRQNFLEETYQVQVTSNNRLAAKASEVLILAIKPQMLNTVVTDLSNTEEFGNKPLVISILAGVTLKRLEALFLGHPVIRAMPNTPATVGAGITAIAQGKAVNKYHISQAQSIFAAVGQVVEVAESLMDSVTGLSGSGPAFVAMMIEALADGGVSAGLPRSIANQLALETVLGTAQLLKKSGLHPAELKDRVTSPGGTTIAGVRALEKGGFRGTVIEAVRAAYERSQELA